jgi:uncharacterized repeat protein (TIGR01451 family)
MPSVGTATPLPRGSTETTLTFLQVHRVHRRPGRRPGRSRVRRGVLVLAVTVLSVPAMSVPASASASLVVTPITWNVVGMDSNKPALQGPDTFASGARVCNTGDATATNVVSSFIWDSANVYVNSAGLTTLTLPSLDIGSCSDFYYNLAITRNAAAFDTTRAFHITATADGLGVASTPVPREIYVEHLVSQNRNAIDSIVGPTTVYVGNTYTFVLNSHTAPGGYEQLSSFLNFPNSIFQIVSVSSTYTAPPGATGTTIYGDACGWDPVPTSVTYRSCIGPENFLGGKVGDTVATTYVVKVVAGGTSTVSALVYDFSGSSYHYNSDFGVGINSVTITALDQTDVGVSVSDSPDPVTAGTDLTYTITVSNAGTSDATGVQLTDPIPAGTSFASASDGGTLSSGIVTWSIGTIAAGGSVTRTLVVHVGSDRTSALTDAAHVTTTSTDPNGANDSATANTAVVTSADLSIAKSDSTDPVGAGENLTYTLDVANGGPSDAAGLVVTDALPAGVAYVSSTMSQGSCSQAAGTVTCALGGLASGGAASVTIVVVPGTAGAISNTASVSSSTSDPSSANNSSTQGTTVEPRADLSITKSSSPNPVEAGADLTYTIVVSNAGPSSATSVAVDDPLPTGTDFVAADQGGVLSSGIVTWSLGTIASGASVTLTLVVHVHPTRTNDLSNTATVSSATVDPDASNDDATEDTSVTPLVDLSVGLDDGSASVTAGSSTTYDLVLSNGGPAELPAGAVVTAPVPAGTSASESEADCDIAAGTITCTTSAALTVGSSIIWQVTLDVDPDHAPGTVDLTAEVAFSPYLDSDPSNDSATDSDVVGVSADVSVTVDDGVGLVTAGDQTTYSVTLSNGGPSSVPPGATVVSLAPLGTTATESETDCQVVLGLLGCTTAVTLAPGDSVTWQVTLALDPDYALSTLDVTAAVGSSPIPDPDASNDSATDADAVTSSADLAVNVDDGATVITPGSSATYLVTLSNGGPSTEPTGVTVTVPVPAGTSPSESEADCQISGALLTCTTPTSVAPGGSIVWQLTLALDPGSVAVALDVTAGVSSAPLSDTDASNDSATDTDVVGASADVAVSITDVPDPVDQGQPLTYTLNVSNAGPSGATAVTVVDTLPPSVAFVSGTPSQGTCSHAAGVVTCDLGTIGTGAAASIAIVVTPGSTGTITDQATVSATETDPDPANNTDSEDSLVEDPADLSVQITDAPDPVLAGQDVTYALAVANAGPSDATGVVVTDPLPAGVVFVSATPTQGTCSQALGIVTCPIGGVLSGGSATVVIVVTTTVPGVLTDQASVSGNEPDGQPANDSDSESTSVNAVGGPSADLSISIVDAPDPASVGQDVTYTATVANAGPAGATSVTLTDTLPAGVNFVSATSSQGACSQLAGTVTCTLGSMVSGGSATVTIVVRPTVPGTIIDAATVQAAEVDPTPADASDSESTQVDASADLSITKIATPNPVALGQNLTYTMVVGNAGPSDATGVTLTDPLPAGVTFVSANSPLGPCGFASGTMTCTIGNLTANASAMVTLVVTPTIAGAVSNTATVDANEADPAAPNDAATADATVSASADLSLTKTASPDPVIAGEDLVYTLVVRDAGPSDAAGVTVSDPLPAGMAFVSADADGTEAAGIVTWALGALPSNSSVTLTVVVRPDASMSGHVMNTASVVATTADPDSTDNDASATVTVDPPGRRAAANLSVTKTVNDLAPTTGDLVTYTISITDEGPADATGVVVMDAFPSGLAFVSAEASKGAYDDATGNWEVGDLARGDVEHLDIRARIVSGASIDNVASVAAVDQSDPEQGNDASVQGLTVTKTTDPTDPALLAITGSQVGGLTVLAVALLVAGLALILIGRRQEDEREPSAPW